MALSFYHEEDYDGIVIKLPNWFIKMNNLEHFFDNTLLSELKKSRFSIHHPDFTKTIFELGDRLGKADANNSRKRLAKKELELFQEKKQKQHSKEWFKIETKKYFDTQYVFDYNLTVGGEIFTYNDILTRSGVTSKFNKAIHAVIADKGIKGVLAENESVWIFGMLRMHVNLGMETSNFRFYQNNEGNLAVSYDVLSVRWLIKNNTRYTVEPIEKDTEGNLWIRTIQNAQINNVIDYTGCQSLCGYIKSGGYYKKLILKQL